MNTAFICSRRDEFGQDVPIYDREVRHIGEEHEGYFTADHFCLQVAKAAQIAACKYPPENDDVNFVFGQAKIHMTYEADALVPHRMNVKPGGKAPIIETFFVVHNQWGSSDNDSSGWSPQRFANGARGEGSGYTQTCEGANDSKFGIT